MIEYEFLIFRGATMKYFFLLYEHINSFRAETLIIDE